MPRNNWREFLTRWSRELLACECAAEWNLPAEVIASGWMGFPGATKEEIEASQARLGIMLPPSYREFLEVSNGWRTTGHFIDRLWPAPELQLLSGRHADFVETWSKVDANSDPIAEEDYRVYEPGRSQPPRMIYLETAIELGDCELGDIFCLLNPQIGFPDGECEIWYFDVEVIGDRFQSFWEFMQDRRDAFLIANKPTKPLRLADNALALVAKLPELIEKFEGIARSWKSVNSKREAERLYNEGVALEVEGIAKRLSEIKSRSVSPDHFVAHLDEMVGLLEEEWEEMEKRRLNMIQDLATHYSQQKGRDGMFYTGRVHGLQKVIGPIRWFHYESA